MPPRTPTTTRAHHKQGQVRQAQNEVATGQIGQGKRTGHHLREVREECGRERVLLLLCAAAVCCCCVLLLCAAAVANVNRKPIPNTNEDRHAQPQHREERPCVSASTERPENGPSLDPDIGTSSTPQRRYRECTPKELLLCTGSGISVVLSPISGSPSNMHKQDG